MTSRGRFLHASLTLILMNSISIAAPQVPPAPTARVEPVTDTYFGETLSDPYRWMENDKDPEWLPFLKAQNDHARAVLEALPGRDALLKRIQQSAGDIAAPAAVQRAGGRLFFEQRPAGADNFKLFVREGGKTACSSTRHARDRGASHFSLDWWEPRPTAQARGLRPVEGRQRGFDAPRPERRRGTICPSESPTPKAPSRSGSMTAAASSTTS